MARRTFSQARAGVLAAAGFVLLASTGSEARADPFKDEKLGYSLNTPKKWKRMPVATDERWIVAKFQSEREFETNDKQGFWARHTPFLDVVVIPLSLAEEKGGTVEKGDDGKIKIKLAAPWKDLREYLDKTLQQSGGGGFYFSKEEECQVGGLKVIQYEATMDKLADSPKRVYGWAYYTEDAIYGLVSESLIQFEEKLKPDILAAFKSFKHFPRTGVLPGAERTGDDIVITDPEDNRSDADKEKERKEAVTRRLHKVKESLPAGWTTKESDNFIAVSHADAKYTKNVLDHCEALRAWLDDNLAFLGNGYTGRTIIRICKDREEYEAFAQTGGWWSSERVEISTYQDRDGWSYSSMRMLNRGVWDVWINDKNPNLRWGLPAWIRTGLDEVIASAESKGRKVEFKVDTDDKVRLAQLRRAKELLPAKNYFTMTTQEVWSDYDNHYQAGYLVRSLLFGAAAKNPKYKNAFADYLKNLVILLDEEAAKKTETPEGMKEPENEQEEDAMHRARAQEWQQKERETLTTLVERTFPGWTDKEWDKLHSLYMKEYE